MKDICDALGVESVVKRSPVTDEGIKVSVQFEDVWAVERQNWEMLKTLYEIANYLYPPIRIGLAPLTTSGK